MKNEALGGIKEIQLEDNYLNQKLKTMDLKITMVKVMEKGKLVSRPFVLIWHASPKSKSFTSECNPRMQELNYVDRAKIEVCYQHS